jgi:hypothetical protein
MLYKGLNCFSNGQATLYHDATNDDLVINNLGTSGLDGVTINTLGYSNIHVEYDNSTLVNGGKIKVATIGKNALGQFITLNERLIWYDAQSQKIQYAYNAGLLPASFNLIGSLNGSPVFDEPIDNPKDEPSAVIWVAIGAIAALIGAGVAIYNAVKSSHIVKTTRTYNSEGKWTVTREETIDPNPVTIEVNGQFYLVDTWGVKVSEEIPEAYENNIPEILGVQITTSGISNLKLTNITV